MQQRLGVFIPIRFHRASAGQNDYDVGINFAHLAQEPYLVFGDAHMLPVNALGLAAFVKPQPHEHRVRTLGKLTGLLAQPAALAAASPEAGRKAYDVHALCAQRVKAAFELGRLDVRAACALIARRFRKIADNGDARAGPERQNAVLIFQQHRTLFRKACGKFVVLGHVAAGRVPECLLGIGNKTQQARNALVKKLALNRAALHGLKYLPVGLTAGAGHFKAVAGDQAANSVVIAAPVGDDEAVVAPLACEDILQKVLVFVGVLPV